jgi:hypothetical protein
MKRNMKRDTGGASNSTHWLTRRMVDSPRPPRAFVDFRTSAYRVIDD